MAFTYKDYVESENVKKRQQALDELQAPAAYTSPYGEKMDALIGQYADRKPFTYDVNADALYQQYRDQYIRGGNLAMKDTMGQAATMTGGYGNSYAASAGNQAYQQYLGRLNDVVPQLYQLAYQRYQQEGQDLKDLYGLYQNKDSIDYGRYRDSYNDYYTDRSYLSDRLDRDRTYEYGLYGDAYSRALAMHQQQVAEDQFAQEMAYKYAALYKNGYGGSGGGSSSGGRSSSAGVSSSGGKYAGQSTGDFSNGWKGPADTTTATTTTTDKDTKSDKPSKSDSVNETAVKNFKAGVMTNGEYSSRGGNGESYKDYINVQIAKAQKNGKIAAAEANKIRKDYGI